MNGFGHLDSYMELRLFLRCKNHFKKTYKNRKKHVHIYCKRHVSLEFVAHEYWVWPFLPNGMKHHIRLLQQHLEAVAKLERKLDSYMKLRFFLRCKNHFKKHIKIENTCAYIL
jgi:hypothetical protein